jgi:hypothetical protein
MKKLGIKIAAIIAVCYVPVFAYIELAPNAIYTNRYGICRAQYDAAYHKTDQIPAKTLFLGDSRIMSAVYCTQIPHARNLSLAGSTPIEMYYYLQNYIKNNGNPQQVVLSFAPFHYTAHAAFAKYCLRFKLLNINEIKEIYANARHTNDKQTLSSRYPEINHLKYYLKYPEYYQTELKYSLFENRTHINKLVYDSVRTARGQYVFGKKNKSEELCEETLRKDYEPTPLLQYYLDKIFEVCARQNIKILMVTPPFNQASYAKITPEYKKSHQKWLQNIRKTYPNARIIDTLYVYPNQYFGDGSHVNAQGAAYFTKKLLDSGWLEANK